MTKAIEIKGLSMRYGNLWALDNVSLRVEKGEMLAVLGPSGCGKSTLLTLIAGLKKSSAGEIALDDSRIDHLPPQKRDIGFLFQNYALFPNMTVRENIGFGLKIRNYSKQEIKQRVDELIDLVGLKEHAEKKPRQLSGGQQQRVALARALAPKPQVILLDEPLSALDVKIRQRLRTELKTLQKELGITTIIVTHDQDEAFELGDRVAVMNEGRVEQLAKPEEVYDYPASEFVARFVGNINVLPGKVVEDKILGAGFKTVIPADLPQMPEGTEVKVLIRPENLELTKAFGSKEAFTKEKTFSAKGTIIGSTFLGSHFKVEVGLEGGLELTISLSKQEYVSQELQKGDRVSLQADKSQIINSTTQKIIGRNLIKENYVSMANLEKNVKIVKA